MKKLLKKKDFSDLPASAQAFLALRLREELRIPILWIVAGPGMLDCIYNDLLTLAGKDASPIIPFFAVSANDSAMRGERLGSLRRLLELDEIPIVVTCVKALAQPVISPVELRGSTRKVKVGDDIDPEELADWFLKQGYAFTPEVQIHGEASLRGGILDVWSPVAEWPARIEFFGSRVESIRIFDPAEQRSVEGRNEIAVIPPHDNAVPGEESSLLDYLPLQTGWVWSVPAEFHEFSENAAVTPVDGSSLLELEARSSVAPQMADDTPRLPELVPAEALGNMSGNLIMPDVLEKRRREYLKTLAEHAGNGADVQLYFYTEGTHERFIELYGDSVPFDLFQVRCAPLSSGFRCESERLFVVAESDLWGHRKERSSRRTGFQRKAVRHREFERIQTWTDLQPGDLVVHVERGVGRYLGLYEIAAHSGRREMLAVEYADDARLYVPPVHAHLLSRYIGVGSQRSTLSNLGGGRWEKQKISAQRSIEDLAASMLETQAARETMRGYAFQKDCIWQHELENSFPYEETEDQNRAIIDVKADMESGKPMDRLLCGDVGYGKTEVAMRAAFKAVMSGRQVAVLVPTTILAQQHYETFTARMEAFPVTIGLLSRFRSHREQNETIDGMKNGSVDIVIGTHRLVQSDVSFKNLGLVIIDEEQRFGVGHKEKLKQLRNLVDVLTLTATPIPRTLYMSLAGAKDMSTIQTAPRERQAVETIVTSFSEELVRHAVMRELGREGQVYILHNRVKSICGLCERLQSLIPEARMAIAHGQMLERELASVMRAFSKGDIDVLLCTTIIESGVDIPNVNTILIDRADRFGLADLYQLRGRVGRYNRKAYAYLLLPRDGELFDTARKRIRAIQRYSGLGAGFNLALRDLEIRGAGNLLGRKQSGHIASVGFDLYCQLLKRTITRLRGGQPERIVEVEVRLDFIDESPSVDSTSSAMLPYSYMEDEDLRLRFYRDLAGCDREKDVADLLAGLKDRFGPPPLPLKRLLDIARLRILAAGKGIGKIEVEGGRVVMRRGSDYIMFNKRFPRLKSDNPSKRIREIRQMIRSLE